MSNEDFDSIVEGLELEEPDDAVDYSNLNSFDLSRSYSKLKQDLLELGEMLHPRTEKGRELHSRRAAMVVELRKRHLIG